MIKSIFSIMLIFILAGCSDKPLYEIKDVGMSAVDGSINWLDNERVIFVNKDMPGAGKIYIWNTETGTIELYAPEALGGICYSDGFITYGVKILNNTTYIKTGLMGEEKLVVYDWDDEQLSKVRKNRYSCKRFIPPEEHKDKHIHYLKEEHGYLYIGTLTGKDNEYIQYVNQEGISVQLPIKEIGYRHPNGYYDLKSAYFLWGVRGASSTWNERCQSAWWIYPNAKTEKMCVPLIDGVINGSVMVYPFKEGYLFISHGRGGRKDAGNSGIYRIDLTMQPEQKLISGQANGIAISPDGCKAAFRHNPLISKNIQLKTITLCNGTKGS